MRSFIYCKTEHKGEQSFYLNHYGKTYYLFTQAYRVSVKEHFQNGYIIDKRYNYSSSHGHAVRKTLDKIRQMIPFIEKECNISVLRKTQRKGSVFLEKKSDKKYNYSVISEELFDYCYYGGV